MTWATLWVPTTGDVITAARLKTITDSLNTLDPTGAAAGEILKVNSGADGYDFELPAVYKYKSSTQVFTANTTYADIAASSGNLAFAIAVNEVWHVHFYLRMSYTDVGGVKLQLTGPAAPTSVNIDGFLYNAYVAGATNQTALSGYPNNGGKLINATAFSANIMTQPVTAGGSGVGQASNASGDPKIIELDGIIANGANAGTVTLQGAQNSAAGTTTFGVGSFMRAEKVE